MKLIEKISWKQAAEPIKAVNAELYNLLKQVIAQSDPTSVYFYRIRYKFAECIIENGKTKFLDAQAKLQFVDNSGLSTTLGFDLQKEFEESIKGIKGHPLAVITKNYIEIYKAQYSSYAIKSYGDRKTYDYPLNQLGQGELFGIWESINMMFDDTEDKNQGWQVVSGKHCVLTTLPSFWLQEGQNGSKAYRQKLIKLYDRPDNYLEVFNQLANKILEEQGLDYFAETLIIPKQLYTIGTSETSIMVNAKRELREYIFKHGWAQAESRWSIKSEDFKIITEFEMREEEIGFALPLIKHLTDIVGGKKFLLRPICEKDGILVEVVKRIIKDFHSTEFKNYNGKSENEGKQIDVTMLEYNTPIFFHYNKLNDTIKWGFEMIHSPSMEYSLPMVKVPLQKELLSKLNKKSKLANYLSTGEQKICIRFYVNNSDNSMTDAEQVKNLIMGPINEVYGPMLPEGTAIKVTQYPWFFNVLMFIEREAK